MHQRQRDVAICVVGAGPAGCIASMQLSQMGYSVALISKLRPAQNMRAEILSPGAVSQLEALGLSEVVSASRIGAPKVRSLLWGDVEPKRMEAGGVLVSRAEFDARLMEYVETADVAVHEFGGRAVVHRREQSRWQIEEATKSRQPIAAEFLVDATGSGANLFGGVERITRPLAAICARSHIDDGSTNEMFVEALSASWLWAATTNDHQRFTCLFFDPKSFVTTDPKETLRRAITRSKLFNEIGSYDCLKSVFVCNAASFKSKCCVSERHITIGDACVSRDPLLSSGVQGAITSALHGAVVVNTVLRAPEKRNLAMTFHRDRQTETCRNSKRACQAFYLEGSQRWRTAFWHNRSGMPKPSEQSPVQQRIECEQTILKLSPDAYFQVTPVVNSAIIDGAQALCHPLLGQPIAFVCGVPIGEIFDTCQFPAIRSNLIRSMANKIGPVHAKTLVSKLVETGILQEVVS